MITSVDMMTHLKSPEDYKLYREQDVMEMLEYKKNMRLFLGPHVCVYFENFKTVRYQVQQMIFIENLKSVDEFQDEIMAYEGLLPTADSFAVTMMIEEPNIQKRNELLGVLDGIQNEIAIIKDGVSFYAEPQKQSISCVNFLRFPLSDLINSKICSFHPAYKYETAIALNIASSLGDI